MSAPAHAWPCCSQAGMKPGYTAMLDSLVLADGVCHDKRVRCGQHHPAVVAPNRHRCVPSHAVRHLDINVYLGSLGVTFPYHIDWPTSSGWGSCCSTLQAARWGTQQAASCVLSGMKQSKRAHGGAAAFSARKAQSSVLDLLPTARSMRMQQDLLLNDVCQSL